MPEPNSSSNDSQSLRGEFEQDRVKMVMVADIEGQPPNRISNEFGKYCDFRSLTQGGKATLSSCKDTNLGRRVVLKMLRKELRDNPVELRRLIREARITAQLAHPATVPMYELGQNDEGDWYFAMKKIEGWTLFEIIVGLAQRKKEIEEEFDLNRLLNIFTQVGEAMIYAHARGVIHRDIKPENIIVGMFGEVTLIDWGAAKVWGMPNDGDETTAGDRGGTPLYMSPEQVTGSRMVDERSDVYSLGVVMYEMLCQREPFRGAKIADTFDNIVNRQPQPPRSVAPHRFVPAALEEICLRAMKKKPEDRFQSVSDFIAAINKFRNDALMRGSV